MSILYFRLSPILSVFLPKSCFQFLRDGACLMFHRLHFCLYTMKTSYYMSNFRVLWNKQKGFFPVVCLMGSFPNDPCICAHVKAGLSTFSACFRKCWPFIKKWAAQLTMTLLQNRSSVWGSASVVAVPATQLAGWKGEMKLLGMAGSNTDWWHIALWSPVNVLYRARYMPFPPRLTRTMLIKPLSISFPFPPWASSCSSRTQPWGAVAAVAGCDQQSTEVPGPCTVTLCRAAASPASSPSTTNPFPVPLPMATRCNFSCLFFLCNLFRIAVLSSGCF